MINIVLFEPEIPQNTGNIMRTCVATGSVLHLIKPLGFKIDEPSIRRAGVNYIDKLEYHVYENFDDFKEKNPGEYFFYTRYGHKPHSDFDYSDKEKNIYLIFNVSNAVAIVVYEALRQRDYENLLFDEPHKDKDFIMID